MVAVTHWNGEEWACVDDIVLGSVIGHNLQYHNTLCTMYGTQNDR